MGRGTKINIKNSPLIYTDPSGLLVREATGLSLSGSGLLSGLGSLAGRVAPFLWTPGGGGLLNPLPVNQGEDAFLEQLRNSQPNKPALLPPPVRSTPSGESQEKRIPAPIPPNPNEECEETCASKYPQYTPLTEAVGSHMPFGGFQDNTLNQSIRAMQNFRGKHPKIHDYRTLVPQKDQSGTVVADPIDFPKFKNPDGSAAHFNVFIEELLPQAISAGSVGKYRFCQEGKPPTLVWKFGILNIKDKYGNKFFGKQ
ncbi:MAG: hypothetical protein F6K45_26260 [Kamptonema sp. SIO1D9]|nr:hypothetical protein [Kamptonema sp. SIO1D9]